jgi:hypothetical protein
MSHLLHKFPELEVRQTPEKGRGVFARQVIAAGQLILQFQGWLSATTDLQEEWLAMQVGPDLWLCSHGELLDDCVNHGCEPNAGFVTGEPILHALRDIQPGEEITWDYSTSIAEPGWELECRCGSNQCRGIVRSWGELDPAERNQLRPTALKFLQELDA